MPRRVLIGVIQMTDHAPTPNTNAAIEFLKAFAPEGPWCLTAINPDRKGIETTTF